MVDLLTALGAGSIATLVPLYLGIFAPQILSSLGSRLRIFVLNLNSDNVELLLAAFGAGILFWFLVDVLGDAALLGVAAGFTGGYTHVALAGTFAVGLVFLFWLEKELVHSPGIDHNTTSRQVGASTTRQLGYSVALVVALGIGFHAFGEGIGIGADIPSSTSILDAIGGISAGIAYVLHKFLEGLVISIFALLAKPTNGKRKIVLGLLAGIPTILGFFVGLLKVDGTYLFALGAAGGIYAELKLIPVFSGREMKYGLIIAFLLGTYAMYVAGLFHGVQG